VGRLGGGKKPEGKRGHGRPRHGWGGILLKLMFRKENGGLQTIFSVP